MTASGEPPCSRMFIAIRHADSTPPLLAFSVILLDQMKEPLLVESQGIEGRFGPFPFPWNLITSEIGAPTGNRTPL